MRGAAGRAWEVSRGGCNLSVDDRPTDCSPFLAAPLPALALLSAPFPGHNRRTRVKDFFVAFDKLQSGYVSPEQAKRAIALTKLEVDAEEMQMLLKGFAVQRTNYGGIEFDYRAFCQAFSDSDLEKDPARVARNPKSQLLHIDVVAGVPPPPRFIGSLDPEAPPAALQTKAQHGNTTQRWSISRNPGAPKPKPARNPNSGEHPTVASASQPLNKLEGAEKDAFKALIRRLRAIVRQRGIVVKELFRDHDKNKNGLVTINQFRSSLPPFFLLTSPDLKLLEKKYQKGKFGDVNYMMLHEILEIDEEDPVEPDVADPDELCTPLTRMLAGVDPPEHLINRGDRELAVVDLLGRMNAEIFEEKIRLRDSFKVVDKLVTGCVVPDVFQETMINAGMALTEAELVLLMMTFKRPIDGKIDYHAMCKRLEARGTQKITKGGICTAQLLLKIQNQIARRRIRIKEFFADYDKLRKGFVSPDKFKTAVSMAGIELTTAEYGYLKERFVKDGTETTTKDVDYLEFCEWLDAAFNEKNLEQRPGAVPHTFTPHEEEPVYLSEAQATELQAVMERMAKHASTCGVIAKASFQDRDPSRCGRVTVPQFLSSVAAMGFVLTQDEQRLLVARFKVGKEPTALQIRYTEFCTVLDNLVAELEEA